MKNTGDGRVLLTTQQKCVKLCFSVGMNEAWRTWKRDLMGQGRFSRLPKRAGGSAGCWVHPSQPWTLCVPGTSFKGLSLRPLLRVGVAHPGDSPPPGRGEHLDSASRQVPGHTQSPIWTSQVLVERAAFSCGDGITYCVLEHTTRETTKPT